MTKVKIITDSTFDLPADLIKELDIVVVPLKVMINGHEYRDWIDLGPERFYELMNTSNQLPKTSQPSPGEFVSIYQSIIEEGNKVISIHLSSQLSGTYQSAKVVANTVDSENIKVIDSRTGSVAQGLMVLQAAKMANQGCSLNEIASYLENIREKVQLFFMVDTLDNLAKGGRIGRASALVGSLLNIKPILSCDKEGTVIAIDKLRGQNKALTRIAELVASRNEGEILCALAHGNSPMTMNNLESKLPESLKIKQLIHSQIGPVIGTHVGMGAVGLAVLPL